MPFYRTLKEIKKQRNLTAGERILINQCDNGQDCNLNDGARPERADPECTIRADILRFFILGGDDTCPIPPSGINIRGAFIEGQLDLCDATARGSIALVRCRFGEPIAAPRSRVGQVNLTGSAFSRLDFTNAVVGGTLIMDGASSTGGVELVGIVIQGQLSCNDAQFINASGDALNAQGATIGGGAFLQRIEANGEVSFAGATIGGQLACDGGNFINPRGDALNAQRATIERSAFLRRIEANGEVSFAGRQLTGN